MGILVEWASWWNGHLGGMGILPVSFSGRQDAHSTDIHSAPQQLTIRINCCVYASVSSPPTPPTPPTLPTLPTLSTLFPGEDQAS
ncbi:MAG: hypothetical protein F6K38_36030 [Moorea sp. SIO3B2]|nr:hypothetical protein [Moorena sp. SIO3B2]